MPLPTSRRTTRIEWSQCDPAGIIYFPRYFEMFDLSTTVLLERALGMTKREFLKAYGFAGYPTVETRGQFLRPVTYGDTVDIESRISFGTTSFSVEHRVTKDGVPCAEGFEKRVWVVRESDDPIKFKPHPIPREVIAKFGV
jgi:4-hydroxybenzoyl-CoA thioesterase